MKRLSIGKTVPLGLLALLAAACAAASRSSAPASPSPRSSTPVPTETPIGNWQTSLPEEQGMDSGTLAGMLEYILKGKLSVHSVLVLRHGKLVTEAYFYPYRAGTPHTIQSCTTSVMSALVGIAIAEQKIQSVNLPLLSFFPDLSPAGIDDRKRAITLENVLTMTSGLDWSEDELNISDPRNPYLQMQQSPNWIQFVLDRPMADVPGESFDFNSGAVHLLSAVLDRTTGMGAQAFAESRLFEPLDFSAVEWTADNLGFPNGAAGLSMIPRDMAKFGQLFLDRGMWEGYRVIPAQWVDESTSEHVPPLLAGGDGYGYQWWILPPLGAYAAIGRGGQYIIVVPDQDLVAVFTAEVGDDFTLIEQKLMKDILRAVRSDGSLPVDPGAYGWLEKTVHAAAQAPDPVPAPAQPALAGEVSGTVYDLDPNEMGWESLVFLFDDGAAEARMILTRDGRTLDLPIGLDGVPRFTEVEPHRTLSLEGGWSRDNDFEMKYVVVGRTESLMLRFVFRGKNLTLQGLSMIDVWPIELQGRARS